MRACTLREGHSRTKGTPDAEYIWTGGSEVGNLSGSGPANRIETIEGFSLRCITRSSNPKQSSATVPGVIREIEIWRVAVLMVNRYADEAEANSSCRAQEARWDG